MCVVLFDKYLIWEKILTFLFDLYLIWVKKYILVFKHYLIQAFFSPSLFDPYLIRVIFCHYIFDNYLIWNYIQFAYLMDIWFDKEKWYLPTPTWGSGNTPISEICCAKKWTQRLCCHNTRINAGWPANVGIRVNIPAFSIKNLHNPRIFNKKMHIGPYAHYFIVAMLVCLSVPFSCQLFRGSSLALRSHDQIPASHWSTTPPTPKFFR